MWHDGGGNGFARMSQVRFLPHLDDPQLERHMRRSLREQASSDPDPVARDLARICSPAP